MKSQDHQFKLRIPGGLKERLEEEASRRGLSLSAEIIDRLNRSFGTVEWEIHENRSQELNRINADMVHLQRYSDFLDAECSSEPDFEQQKDSVRRMKDRLIELKAYTQQEIDRILDLMGRSSYNSEARLSEPFGPQVALSESGAAKVAKLKRAKAR